MVPTLINNRVSHVPGAVNLQKERERQQEQAFLFAFTAASGILGA
jgi:hypothetical protein